MADAVLALEGIRKSYGDRVVTEVLHGIDLRIEAGEFLALMGPSGSGKSTMLHLMGLLDRPTSGRVRVAGADTAGLDDDELARLRGRTLGFVFQFHHLLPAFTALENVMMPVMADRGRSDDALRTHARELLEKVGLAELTGRRATDLSGGQQQRVAVARALVASPKLILADEPTGNLDTKSAADVFALLRSFNREKGMAVLVVTHDSRLAERCDRIVEMVDGNIVSDQRHTARSG